MGVSYKINNKAKSSKKTNNGNGVNIFSERTQQDLLLQDYAFERSQSSANKQMQFQEYMSNTAHQREVHDLQVAGLNPVLSANGGASVTAGASATMADNATAARTSRLNQQAANRTSIKMNDAQVENAWKTAQLQSKTQLQANKYATDIAAATQLKTAQTAAKAAMYGADRSAAAAMYGAQQSAYAAMYAANQANEASHYNTDHTKTGLGTSFIQGATGKTPGELGQSFGKSNLGKNIRDNYNSFNNWIGGKGWT